MTVWKYFLELIDGKKTRRRIPGNRRKVVWHRDGKRCRYCGKKNLEYHRFHLDHIKPVHFRGSDYTFNLCCACAPCNMKRGYKYWIKPKPLPLWRKVYGLFLMIRFGDYPKPIDFF